MVTVTSIRPNVDLLHLDGKDIYLVGTAHVSSQSAELVKSVIEEVNPDCIAVELCEARFKSLRDPDRWKKTNLATVIRQGKSHVLLAQLLLAAYQKKLGTQLKIKPGAEMMEAVYLAEARSLPCVLADRDINITLRRTWASLGFVSIFKLIFSTMKSLLDKDPQVTEDEIERLKNADALEEVMKEFSAALPEVRHALIDERDQFLACKLREATGQRIVAVVGAAHVPGIKSWITEPIDLAAISQRPRKKLLTQVVGWSIPVLMIAGMVYSFFASSSETFTEIFKTWFWFTALFAALGASVVRAHPLTTLSAFISAPFATLNPFIAAGWVAGLVEAIVRKPQVGDLETIVDDMGTIRGMLNNRVSRTLMIVASTNLFVMLGMAVAGLRVYHIATDAHAKIVADQPLPSPESK